MPWPCFGDWLGDSDSDSEKPTRATFCTSAQSRSRRGANPVWETLLHDFAHAGHAKEFTPIVEHRLDEHTVYTIPLSRSRVTTLNFPGPISAIDGANVTNDPKTPGLFQIAHTKGSHFVLVRALVQKATTNINIRWNKKTYVIVLIESEQPLFSVTFGYADDEHARPLPSASLPRVC